MTQDETSKHNTTTKCAVNTGLDEKSAPQKMKNADEKRIEQWKKKQAENKSEVLFKKEKEVKGKVDLGHSFKKKDLSESQKHEIFMATMCAATGSASAEFSRMLFTQTLNNISAYGDADEATIAKAMLEALLALKPQDEIEGMLISRLLVLHGHYMNCLFETKKYSDTNTIDKKFNQATKLMRLYNESLEALNRYRRKGQQKITVQHVNVSDGGQAIVGNVKTGGGE